jgi:hypothetical protein
MVQWAASALIVVGVGLLFSRTAKAAPKLPAGTVVFAEPGFPAADSATPADERLRALVPGAKTATATELAAALAARGTRLLVLPYGSAFPEEGWPAIRQFLERGGNLLVLGGRPFTRPARREGGGWRLAPFTLRFARELLIDQYQETPGSAGLAWHPNPDVLAVPAFEWPRAFSLIIRLSTADLYPRDGSAGSLDARLDALGWGVKDGRRLAAPLVRIDHLQRRFAGGRWIFACAELAESVFAGELPRTLAAFAHQGAEELLARPRLPLYAPGERIDLEVSWRGPPATVEITVSSPEAVLLRRTLMPRRAPRVLSLAAPPGTGLYTVEARAVVGGQPRAIYRSGFWMRDRESLRAGPRLGVDQDFFQLDGRPLAVAGTTHMASDVQRLFFEHPNVHVWNRDLAEIAGAGLNMVRTGWWSAWDRLVDGRGRARERTLRTIEAYLMTARRHGLPVQLTFFAFLPDVLGGVNAYLDPVALERQRAFIRSVVEPFRDVPFLAWDLINEPSGSRNLWSDRPNRDPLERQAWRRWLERRYPDRRALADAWGVADAGGELALPTDGELGPRGIYAGGSPGRAHDFLLFAQETFAGWARRQVAVIRETGSRQLITVGQDEGGALGRPSPAFFGDALDFTVNHTWWQNDHLLWDSLTAKLPGKPMLIQETGVQRELEADGRSRLDPEAEAALFERKLAFSLVEGAGALQWLWHTNAYMTSGNEAAIGAIRVDGTEKPEAAVGRAFAAFARQLGPHLREPQRPAVVVVASQAAQLSVERELQVQAQQRAVRALAYDAHQPAALLPDNQLAGLGQPRLVILPAAQALSEAAWETLLGYLRAGGTLLVTGPVDRDEHGRLAPRLQRLDTSARIEPLTFRASELRLGGAAVPVTFAQDRQAALRWVRFADGASLRDIPQGTGHLLWAALPVELAEGGEPAASLYAATLGRVGLSAPFTGAVPPGVLVLPTVLADAVLYVLVSERAHDTDLDITDRLTGGHLRLRLPAQRAALALLARSGGALLARYGF